MSGAPLAETGLFGPMAAMVGLTVVVWIWMYVTRLSFMRAEEIDPQQVAVGRERDRLLAPVSGPSDNLRNLFELPVLFYAGVLAAGQLGLDDPWLVRLAWTFVGLRVLHSAIHCTVNRVVPRFVAYAASSVVLFLFWGRLALVSLA